jgi:putative (di)nucleoside polyphosphate hydrolase
MPHYNSATPYRPGVGLMIINKNKEVFVGRRIDSKYGAWQMPQGGIDEGETAVEAALREMLEETGNNNVKILAESANWFYYDVPFVAAQRLWGGKYRGQKQKWFLMEFLGEDEDFDIDTEHPEFSEWRWVDLETLPDIIVYFKRSLYMEVLKEFRSLIEQVSYTNLGITHL